jgi:hypothetical protein
MKLLAYAAAVPLLLGISGQAKAASFAWCQMSGGNYESYLSGIVEIGDGNEAFQAFLAGPFAKGFSDYVKDSFDPAASSLKCGREESLFYANDHIEVVIATNPGIKFVRTGWSGVHSAAKDSPAGKGAADPAKRTVRGGAEPGSF